MGPSIYRVLSGRRCEGIVRQKRFGFRLFLSLGIIAFLTACGGQSSSPPVGAALIPAAAPTVAPYSVALACRFAAVGEYKPGEKSPSREIYEGDYDVTGVAYDRSGNLYVGVNTPTDSWVDEFAPRQTKPSRHISDGIHHPGPMTTDPDGDLYVGNLGVLSRDVVVYKPGSTKPDIKIHDISYTGGLIFAEGHLWVTDYSTNDIRAYHVYPAENKAVLAWLIKRGDVHGPDEVAANKGRLYVLNVPSAGDDYVQEYEIATDKAPEFFTKISAREHLIAGLTTNPADEDVYLSERGSKYEVSVYDKNGGFKFLVDQGLHSPGGIVASPTRYYVANGNDNGGYGDVETFTGKDYDWDLKLPAHCDYRPKRFAIMRP